MICTRALASSRYEELSQGENEVDAPIKVIPKNEELEHTYKVSSSHSQIYIESEHFAAKTSFFGTSRACMEPNGVRLTFAELTGEP